MIYHFLCIIELLNLCAPPSPLFVDWMCHTVPTSLRRKGIYYFRTCCSLAIFSAYGRRVKMKYQEKLDKAQSNTAEMQLANQKLHRQITEKNVGYIMFYFG